MTTNPFIMKVFVVCESPIKPDNNVFPSFITFYDPEVMKNFIKNLQLSGNTISEPMNLLELEQYLMNEINKFLIKVKLAKTCDNYTIQKFNLPSSCTSTFKNYPASKAQFGIGDNIFNNFVYTDSYISSQQTTNDKKSLSQRLRDLQFMLLGFQELLKQIDRPEIKAAFPDEYENIMTKYNQNLSMRAILEQKLDNIYSAESSYGNSKRFLDSTIYTSVLWTILATTLVFYIFKKM